MLREICSIVNFVDNFRFNWNDFCNSLSNFVTQIMTKRMISAKMSKK